MAPKTDVIEQLRARIAELEEENARLKEIEQTNDTLLDQLGDKNAALLAEVASKKHCYAEAVAHYEKQLAASQAYAEQLREALSSVEWEDFHFDRHGNSQQHCPGCGNQKSVGRHTIQCPIGKAIALPRDTSALDAYVSEKVKEAGKFDMWKTNPYTKILETSIKQLTRQRDLAVEALEDVKGCFDAAEFEGLSDRICEANVECGSLADLVMRRLSPALSTVEHAISTIKESKGKR